MKATAKSNIKYNDIWYHAGDVLDIDSKDIASFGNLIDVEKESVSEKPKMVDEKPKFAETKKTRLKVEE